MSTVRAGNQAALVVVDVQTSVVAEAWETSRVVNNVARVVERAREPKIEAGSIVADVNVAMKWISYPGRKNGTATAEEVDFATPGGIR